MTPHPEIADYLEIPYAPLNNQQFGLKQGK